MGIGTSNPISNLDIRSNVIISGNLGIGTTNSISKLDIRFNTNLNSAIPIGARILTVQVAVYLDFGDFRFFEITNQPPQDYIAPEFSLGLDLTGASAQQFLYLKTLQTNISNKNNLSLRFNGDYNALKTNPQIITLDVSSNSYINNSLPMINACLRVKYQTLLNAASPPIIWVSPMVVTYQW